MGIISTFAAPELQYGITEINLIDTKRTRFRLVLCCNTDRVAFIKFMISTIIRGGSGSGS